MKTTLFKTSLLCGLILAAASCKRDETLAPEIPPSDGTEMTLQGGEGASNAVNAVYVDLSAEKQTSIARNSWNLGFYAGADFRVIVNNQTDATALATTFTDINAVNSSNVDFSSMVFNQMAPSAGLFDLVDDTLGRVSHTAIAEISATASQNHVYIINPVLGATVAAENLWKIRVLRNGNNGYTLQYARLADTNFQTANITKDATYNFQFFSFTGGAVQVEPQKADWDFVWSKSMYYTFRGVYLPYSFSDIIFTNHLASVESAEIIIGGDFTTSYTDFNESHLSQVQLTNNRNTIGSTWRSIGMTSSIANTDRYYILKDSSNNIYKIRFISISPNDGGNRGYPQLEYKLVKEG